MNNIILMGRLAALPELKTTPSGNYVTTFDVAVERRYSGKGEERKTDFITCVAWRNTAEFITKWFKKGDPIVIQGELQSRKYQDQHGNNRTAWEVQVNDVRFVPSNKNGNNANEQQPNDFTEANGITDDDLPF